MSWKDESEPNIKFCLGRKIELVEEFITIQNFDTSDGEPMEFEWQFSTRFTTLQLYNKVQEFMSKNKRPIRI